MNDSKAKFIFIGSRQLMEKLPCNLSICVNASVIEPTTSANNLGVYFDSYMTFEKHITEMSKKAIGTIM